ncbi:MAG: hypothetical protein HZA90_21000 [Verrucomicrobia bacterium]|nr:hypothetical protein [Verrucomicrobiota bacterium]
MPAYADTSFLVRAYTPHADCHKALAWLQHAREPHPFTALHRHELRNAIRLRVFRGEITAEQRKLAFQEIESDLADNILTHTPIPWTDTFRESEDLAAIHTEKLGVRSFDILLSSEVGCEGLDYEFCDRLVNYDIPWNPMRLEQRIGRIDRFGQRSEKVLIFNFVTPGTVEERIFFRCFERLGIFRDTVGDCEEVLGEMSVTEQLLELARNPQLTPEQAEAKARQIADNALRVVEEQRRLEQEGGALLGLDQALADEAASAQAEGHFIALDELRDMIQLFLARPEFGGALEPDREQPVVYRLRLNKEARAALAGRLRSWQPRDRSLTAFRRWLDGAEPYLLVTFDQATAVEHRELSFITPVHPLARLATEAFKHRQQPFAAPLRVKNAEVPAGIYVFACDLWETVAIRPELRLVPLA